jgi:Leucine-rich repeat (LRR) protein
MNGENLEELYRKLIDSYSESNLHKIAHNLIRLYREKEYDKLQVIAEIVSETEKIESVTNKQGFSKLISVYHPDRIQYYHNELEKYATSRDPKILHRLKHILLILNIEEIVNNIECLEDIDYCPEFKWDVNEESFTYFTVSPDKSEYKRKIRSSKAGCTFYDAMKIRMYGNTRIEFPSCYLENMEEIEMAEAQIDNLDGIEYCIHTETMDLSGNRITDLSPLWGLTAIRDLNLADNRICDIDALSSLHRLRSIDLSNNPINDLSPLFELGVLEYVDLTGRKYSAEQVSVLIGKGIIINTSDVLK